MALEDAETRVALATSDSEARADLEAALLDRAASNLAERSLSKRVTFLDRVTAFEKGIFTALLSKQEKQKELYTHMTEEELVELYTSPELAHLSGFEKLKKIHQVAPPAINYDASQPISTLLCYTGTGLELALHRPDFWILLILHVTLSCVYYGLGYSVAASTPTAPGWPRVNTSLVALPGSLMTFVLVFYLNQTFSRYSSQFQHILGASGLLGELVLLLRVHLGDHLFPRARYVRHHICKTLNAIHILAYASLPMNRAININVWAWWFLVDSKLLTQEQVDELRQLQSLGNGNLVYKEVVLWANRGVWAQVAHKRLDPMIANLFTSKLWEIRGHLDGLYTFVSGPVPFAYYHLLNMVLIVYLFMLSYTFVFVAPYWSIPGFFLILVGLLGIRELGNFMSNPLGYDKMDIPVFDIAHQFLVASAHLINRSASYAGELEDVRPADAAGNFPGTNGMKADDTDELLALFH